MDNSTKDLGRALGFFYCSRRYDFRVGMRIRILLPGLSVRVLVSDIRILEYRISGSEIYKKKMRFLMFFNYFFFKFQRFFLLLYILVMD